LISKSEAKVDNPVTLNAPPTVTSLDTSTDALISTLEAKVDNPDTFKVSSSVCPLTSKLSKVPTEVRDELTTVVPRVVLFNTESEPVLNSPPTVTPRPMEDSNVFDVLL
jgi:hypothetical protein